MNETLFSQIDNWITVVELPALSALFWMIWHGRRETDGEIDALKGQLSAHQIEIARHYAPSRDLHTLENRLTAHLLRIESKLDATALKTEKISGRRGE
ncbi:MAG: hypothetical protein JNK24_05305 [Alphaproteobacteria bacterium]|nr:hypothetical protein [Alphaproteobacteria bacterium]